MAGEEPGVEPGRPGGRPDDTGDGFSGQAAVTEAAVAVDGTEHPAVDDGGHGQPDRHLGDRALVPRSAQHREAGHMSQASTGCAVRAGAG